MVAVKSCTEYVTERGSAYGGTERFARPRGRRSRAFRDGELLTPTGPSPTMSRFGGYDFVSAPTWTRPCGSRRMPLARTAQVEVLGPSGMRLVFWDH